MTIHISFNFNKSTCQTNLIEGGKSGPMLNIADKDFTVIKDEKMDEKLEKFLQRIVGGKFKSILDLEDYIGKIEGCNNVVVGNKSYQLGIETLFSKSLEEKLVEKEQRLSLYEQWIDAGELAAHAFFESVKNGHIDLKECNSKTKISLLKKIISNCVKSKTRIGLQYEGLSCFQFINDFKKLTTHTSRLEFIENLLSLGDVTISFLPYNSPFTEQLKEIPYKERLEICDKISTAGPNTINSLSRCSDLKEFGFTEDFNRMSVEAFLKESKIIPKWITYSMMCNHQIFTRMTKEQKFIFCRNMAKNGVQTFHISYIQLYNDFNVLKNHQERINFIEELAEIHINLVNSFSFMLKELKLDTLPSKEKIALCELLAFKFKCSVAISLYFDELAFVQDFQSLDENERINLFKHLVSFGEQMIKPLLSNLKQFRLDKLEPQKQQDFYEYILEKGGEYTAECFIKSDNIQLSSFDMKTRIKFCRQLIDKKPNVSWYSKEYTQKFCNDNEIQPNLEDILGLIRHASPDGLYVIFNLFNPNESQSFINTITDKKMRFQILLEIMLAIKDTPKKNHYSSPLHCMRLLLSKNNEQNIYSETFQVLWPFLAHDGEITEEHLEKFKDFLSKHRFYSLLSCFEEIQKEEHFVQRLLMRWLAYTAGALFEPKEYIVDESLTVYNEKTEIHSKLFNYTGPSGDSKLNEKELLQHKNKKTQQENLPKKFEGFLKRQKKHYLLPDNFEQLENKLQALRKPAYMMGVLNVTPEEVENIEGCNMCDLVYNYRNPSLRPFLIRQFGTVKKLLGRPSTEQSLSLRCAEDLARLLVSRWVELGLDEKKGRTLFDQIIKNSDLFKDTKQLNKLLVFLSKTIEKYPIEQEEHLLKYQALDKALNDPKTCLINLSSLNSIESIFSKKDFKNCLLDFIEDKKTLQENFSDHFKHLFDLKDIPNLFERYEKTFGQSRHPTALFIYLESVCKLSGQEKETTFACLKTYVEAVLKNEFPSMRYESEKNGHLKKIFEAKPEIKELWTKRRPLAPLVVAEESEKEMDYKEFLLQKINDKHLQNVPVLEGYLKGTLSLDKAIEELSEKSIHSRFQLLAIHLCEKKISAKKFVSKTEKLLRQHKEFNLGEFQNDLAALQKKKATGEFIIGLSDDREDLLLIGTEVNGSCQRIDGDSSLNKCLVSYLSGGEVIPIIVKSNGVIIARSMLRLLWDETKETPVLLQERLYTNVNNEIIRKAINEVAVQTAKELGISLVTKEIKTENQKPYDGSINFLGGTTPFIYSDAAGGVQDGTLPFEIKKCHEILC